MDEDAALSTARVAGLATLAIGSALLVAPRTVGPWGGLTDASTARAVGLVDLALVPGLLVGHPRWPWLAARAAANVVTASVAVRGGRSGQATAATLALLTVLDGRAAHALHARRR